MERNDPLWYRDAIIYQVHVKSFFDANGDGVGDFNGLTEKLDYIRDLGATAIWVMPFYPSPLRDDGYDISDYRAINPVYGTLRDFRRFVREAHARDLRVITELVINHTSDQHPWFQRARKGRPGSAARDFYVWSETTEPFSEARIIFVDSEPSNWTWDPVAKAHFWHRFYRHQPDLNFDNPRVLEAVLNTMRYWLDMGVDGLRLDAVPYLVERPGTNCENLPETHAIIKKIRAALDASYPDRMLLAEANQWPEDAAKYFGDGDECHMAFHFPLMPRIFISVALEDRHPVTDIMRQTPEIPETSQWAIFLRNHDELTLEMVTGQEREYLWSFYASETRARINLGIRRRLAPLLENDRRKIELLNFMLLSMPGTPVLYYGDEIGMGDNIYLGDRDGVRTPMQWSPDRNGGFSRANPARVFLPVIQDSVYGYEAVNIESQAASPSSLLNWMRAMIAVRRRHRAFGRGMLRFLYPANRKVLAYLRIDGAQSILCVANVSGAAQAVELDLSNFKGATPRELNAGTAFPAIGGLPYLLTLPAYGYYWFLLDPAEVKERFGPSPVQELFTLVLTGKPERLLTGREGRAFEQTIAPTFLRSRRWFAAKDRAISKVAIVENALLPNASGEKAYLLLGLEVEFPGKVVEHYFAPLVVDEGTQTEETSSYLVALVRRGATIGSLLDAEADPGFARQMLTAFRTETEFQLSAGRALRFVRTESFDESVDAPLDEIRRFGGEQSNSSIMIGDKAVLKLYRKLQNGENIEIEMTRYLSEQVGFRNVAPVLGFAEVSTPEGATLSVAMLQRFVRNQGDAWNFVLTDLARFLGTPSSASPKMSILDESLLAKVLGTRTAELHLALAKKSDNQRFTPQPADAAAAKMDIDHAHALTERAFKALERLRAQEAYAKLLAKKAAILALLSKLGAAQVGIMRTRIHGDYHLGQVLMTEDDIIIVDFEGEPGRPLSERAEKSLPVQDVAGMLRSFAYAAEVAGRDVIGRLALDETEIIDRARAWASHSSRVFLKAYRERMRQDDAAMDGTAFARLLRFHLLRKALYEIEYEANNRPDWVGIPVRGTLDILSSGGDMQ